MAERNCPKCGAKLCIVCNQAIGPSSAKGLCSVCYTGAVRAVKDGETTWEEMVDLGLARPILRKRPPAKALQKALTLARRRGDADPPKPAEGEVKREG